MLALHSAVPSEELDTGLPKFALKFDDAVPESADADTTFSMVLDEAELTLLLALHSVKDIKSIPLRVQLKNFSSTSLPESGSVPDCSCPLKNELT